MMFSTQRVENIKWRHRASSQ